MCMYGDGGAGDHILCLHMLDITQCFMLKEKEITRTFSSLFLTTQNLHQLSNNYKTEDSLC